MIKYYDAELDGTTGVGIQSGNYSFNDTYGSTLTRNSTRLYDKNANVYKERTYNVQTKNRTQQKKDSSLKNEKNKNQKLNYNRTNEEKNVMRDNMSIVRDKEIVKKNRNERKKYATRIFDILLCFSMLMVITYRYATINANFRKKENLKKELASIQKENEQLKVSIEKQMNYNAIEQEAKEKLGMQKLDNSQKVYINLDKSDYTESSQSLENPDNASGKEETWWSKLLKDLFKIDD